MHIQQTSTEHLQSLRKVTGSSVGNESVKAVIWNRDARIAHTDATWEGGDGVPSRRMSQEGVATLGSRLLSHGLCLGWTFQDGILRAMWCP